MLKDKERYVILRVDLKGTRNRIIKTEWIVRDNWVFIDFKGDTYYCNLFYNEGKKLGHNVFINKETSIFQREYPDMHIEKIIEFLENEFTIRGVKVYIDKSTIKK